MASQDSRIKKKIVKHVLKRVPEARQDRTDEGLPRWRLQTRTAWLEYEVDGKLQLLATTLGGSTVTAPIDPNEKPKELAARVEEALTEPIQPVEEGAERPL